MGPGSLQSETVSLEPFGIIEYRLKAPPLKRQMMMVEDNFVQKGWAFCQWTVPSSFTAMSKIPRIFSRIIGN